MDFSIRKANGDDKAQIARTLAYCFEQDFSGLTKDMERIARVLENGVDARRFIVAEYDSRIIGITGCADFTGRALSPTKKDCINHLGFIRGSIAYIVLYEESIKPLKCPATTGVIDFVSVLENARGKGVAKAMLDETVESNPQYSEFILNVKDNNDRAIGIYERFGFAEYERVPYKWAKQRSDNVFDVSLTIIGE